ncbi:GroES-like protein [Vararia minispora EC-137]|uniref:GroES-like protein n=1 Tax=Vararia minispora EC-137 TaxID=1314806 RepID=A0ACB8QBM6_9AGAM|nr:GroES-like protein [Vararia minispora EC-137]
MSLQKALLLCSKDAGRFILGTRPIPRPGAGQVLVKNIAVALNPADFYIQKLAIFVDEYDFPAVAGCDGAGTIADLGEGVRGWRVGDKILYQSHWNPDTAAFQEHTLVDAVRIAKIPPNVTCEQACTLPLALATAAIGMYADYAQPPGSRSGGAALTEPWAEGGRGKYAGQPTLVIGGSSSVGQLAIQLAKLSGFDPIITTASKHNFDYCRAAGATHCIDYHATAYEQLPAAVAAITDKPLGFVYNAIALSKESQDAAWAILAPNGTLAVTAPPLVGKANDVAEDGKRVAWMSASVHVGPHQDMAKRMYGALTGMIERGDIQPNNVELVHGGLAGIPDALSCLEEGKISGVKLVARIADTP